MRTEDAIRYFNNKRVELAKALDISPGAVSQWGPVVPELRAYQLERITGGELKAQDGEPEPEEAKTA